MCVLIVVEFVSHALCACRWLISRRKPKGLDDLTARKGASLQVRFETLYNYLESTFETRKRNNE